MALPIILSCPRIFDALKQAEEGDSLGGGKVAPAQGAVLPSRAFFWNTLTGSRSLRERLGGKNAASRTLFRNMLPVPQSL